jgi:hypothetical protein
MAIDCGKEPPIFDGHRQIGLNALVALAFSAPRPKGSSDEHHQRD